MIVGQRPQCEVRDPCYDRVQEIAVVRDEYHGVRIGSEVCLEPVARVEIEMIGRFVEQQEVWLAKEQLRQCQPHLPAS